ncbi:unnamed protein product, partial [Discosporangium mesarthrocarpum]
YEVGKELGQGASGVVNKGVSSKDGRPVALKFVYRKKHSTRVDLATLEEARILSSLKHDRIVQLYGFYRSPREYCLSTELLGGGELFDDIVRRNSYTEDCARGVRETGIREKLVCVGGCYLKVFWLGAFDWLEGLGRAFRAFSIHSRFVQRRS